MTTITPTSGRGIGRRTFLKTGAALGIALSLGVSPAFAQEVTFPPVATAWTPMAKSPAGSTVVLDWTAPSTATPEGLVGDAYFRLVDASGNLLPFGTTSPPGTDPNLLHAGVGIDPHGREMVVTVDDAGRLLAGLVVEGDQLGVSFSSGRRTPAGVYHLVVTDAAGQNVLQPHLNTGAISLAFLTPGGSDGTTLGPVTTTFVESPGVNIEEGFTYYMFGPKSSLSQAEFDEFRAYVSGTSTSIPAWTVGMPYQHVSGPGDIEVEPEAPVPFTYPKDLYAALNSGYDYVGYNLHFKTPTFEIIGTAPEFEVVGSSSALDPSVYRIEAEVRRFTSALSWEVVTDVTVEMQLLVDGVPETLVNPFAPTPAPTPTPTPEPTPGLKTLTVTSTAAERAYYAFTVSSRDVTKSTANGATINASDYLTTRLNGAVGYVGNLGKDSFQFSGSLVSVWAKGPLSVAVDGVAVAVKAPTVVTIGGTVPRDDYRFGVTGWAFKSTANGATINAPDVVSGPTAGGITTVSGFVRNNGRDSYEIVGEVLSLASTGTARLITASGQAVELSRMLPNKLTIRGTGAWAYYTFATGGTVMKSTEDGASIDAPDVITGQTVSGRVRSGTDAYRFGGDLSGFRFTSGTATVSLNDAPYAA